MNDVGDNLLEYSVIGNTADFGSVILGSSPSIPTKNIIL